MGLGYAQFCYATHRWYSQAYTGLHNYIQGYLGLLSRLHMGYTCTCYPNYTCAIHGYQGYPVHMGYTCVIHMVIQDYLTTYMVIQSDPGLSGYTWYPQLCRLYTYRIYTHVLSRLHMVITGLHIHGYNRLQVRHG